MRGASKESFVVAYENSDGSLEFYSDLDTAPITFNTYSRALRAVIGLEDGIIPSSRTAISKTPWQVYRMKFELVGSKPF